MARPLIARLARSYHWRPIALPLRKSTEQDVVSQEPVVSRFVNDSGPESDSKRKRRRDRRPLTDDEIYYYYIITRPFFLPADKTLKSSFEVSLAKNLAASSLPEDLRAEPLAASKRADITIDLAGKCLAAFSHTARTSSRDSARQKIVQEKAGSKALAWLWKTKNEGSLDFLKDVRFMNTLADCLVAEGREEYLWQWMRLEHTPQFRDYNPSGHLINDQHLEKRVIPCTGYGQSALGKRRRERS